MTEHPPQGSDTPDPLAEMPLWKLLLTVGLQAFAFTMVGWAIWVLSGRPRADFLGFAAWEVGYGMALALALILISFALAKAFPKHADSLVREQARRYPFLKNRISIGAILFISICAGLGEEALFRGGLQVLFSDYAPAPLAIALASGLFAAIHLAKPLNTALIFAIGALFGVVYWQSGSLLAVIIAHTVYDIYALWALQNAMHELDVFGESEPTALPANAARETLDPAHNSMGEHQ